MHREWIDAIHPLLHYGRSREALLPRPWTESPKKTKNLEAFFIFMDFHRLGLHIFYNIWNICSVDVWLWRDRVHWRAYNTRDTWKLIGARVGLPLSTFDNFILSTFPVGTQTFEAKCAKRLLFVLVLKIWSVLALIFGGNAGELSFSPELIPLHNLR